MKHNRIIVVAILALIFMALCRTDAFAQGQITRRTVPMEQHEIKTRENKQRENKPQVRQASPEKAIDQLISEADKYYNQKDYGEVAKWYRTAAEQGYAKTQYELGKLYYVGEGVSEDKNKAKEYWEKGATREDNNCKYSFE